MRKPQLFVLLALLVTTIMAVDRTETREKATKTNRRQWKRERRPQISHKKISLNHLKTTRPSVQKLIVGIHNKFRSRVIPPAANMLKMSWDVDAAEDAQRWAEECGVLQHDNTTGRWVEDFGSCGQNIFISTHLVPWYFAIKIWWLEKELFTYGHQKRHNASIGDEINNLSDIGHYTQLVWAATHRVGCGVHQCHMPANTSNKGEKKKMKYYAYVCNYCPIGNFLDRIGTPYERGSPCSSCPGECSFRSKSRKNKQRTVKAKAKRPRRLGQGRSRHKTFPKRKLRRRQRSKRPARPIRPGQTGASSSSGRKMYKKRKKVRRTGKSRNNYFFSGSHPLAFLRQKKAKVGGGLCLNSCPVADLWANCGDLAEQWPDWLCNTTATEEGRERFNHCKATCTCQGKIKN